MLKRLYIYQKEMYPVLSRIFVGVLIFMEIYFILLLNHGTTHFSIGIQEFTGSYTVFVFLFLLRIADDFKDYETDKKLFPDRPLVSGRVHKKDLIVLLVFLLLSTTVLNILFMNNIIFFFILYVYGTLMSVWFFQKNKIQKSLPLALVTHNPVQFIMNIYVISFTCIKYGLPFISKYTILLAFTLYFPALIWEVSRKIRAPKDETEYTTYSKIFGYKKATRFVMILTIVDIVTNFILIYNLNRIALVVLFFNVSWMTWKFVQFMKDPTRFKIVDKVVNYTLITETIMVLVVGLYLWVGKI